MADLNMNAKLPGMNIINSFVRDNLVKPLQNSLKTDAKNSIESENRQEIASKEASSVIMNDTNRKELDETVSQLNDSLQNIQRNLEFRVDEDIGRIVINVRDKETGELVRQIPSEEVLQLAKNLHAASERFNERTDSHSQSTTGGVILRTSV